MLLLCTYIRVISQHGTQTNLMFSKMRLAPVTSSRGQKGKKCKDITLPRLELLAVLIGVRAGNFVTTELKVPISKNSLDRFQMCSSLDETFNQGGGPSQRPRQSRLCFYCLEMGHLKANCHKITRQYPLNYISVDKDVDTVCSSVDIVYNSTQ